VKTVVKIWKCWQVTRVCRRLGQEHTSMKGRVSVEILQLGCDFLDHSFAKVLVGDAVALVRDHSNRLCSDEMVFIVFSLGESSPALSGLVKIKAVPSYRQAK